MLSIDGRSKRRGLCDWGVSESPIKGAHCSSWSLLSCWRQHILYCNKVDSFHTWLLSPVKPSWHRQCQSREQLLLGKCQLCSCWRLLIEQRWRRIVWPEQRNQWTWSVETGWPGERWVWCMMRGCCCTTVPGTLTTSRHRRGWASSGPCASARSWGWWVSRLWCITGLSSGWDGGQPGLLRSHPMVIVTAGYWSECAALTLRCMLGDPCPPVLKRPIKISALDRSQEILEMFQHLQYIFTSGRQLFCSWFEIYSSSGLASSRVPDQGLLSGLWWGD